MLGFGQAEFQIGRRQISVPQGGGETNKDGTNAHRPSCFGFLLSQTQEISVTKRGGCFFLENVAISLTVIVIAFALFFVLSFKGINLFATILLCTGLVSLVTSEGLSSVFTAFMPSAANIFSTYFLMYTLGGSFGYCLMESGLGTAIARHLIRVFGEKWIAVVLFFITCLLVAGGVSSYQFAILAIALPVLKRANLPKKVALAAMSAGGGSVVYGTLIGMPTALNLAPTTYLGTTTTAGAGMSLICSAFSVAFVVWYLLHLSKRCRVRGEGFVAHPDDTFAAEDDEHLPPAWKGYACILCIIALSLVFQYVLHLSALQAVVYAQILSIAFCFLLVGKRFLPHLLTTCAKGFQSSVIPIILIAFVCGYGTVVQNTSAFQWLVDTVMSLNMHPYLLTFVVVNLLSGLTANGVAGVNLYLQTFGSSLIDNPAVNLGAIHRIASISGSGFDSLPHNGAISFQLSVFHLSYREGYFQQFICSVLVNLLAGLLAVIMAMLLY